jgi:hypothetical protein
MPLQGVTLRRAKRHFPRGCIVVVDQEQAHVTGGQSAARAFP